MNTAYLSVGEVATLFGKSTKWVYSALQEDLIAGAFKLNGSWFIDKKILLTDLHSKATKKKGGHSLRDNRHNL
jgi:hypothetical protein